VIQFLLRLVDFGCPQLYLRVHSVGGHNCGEGKIQILSTVADNQSQQVLEVPDFSPDRPEMWDTYSESHYSPPGVPRMLKYVHIRVSERQKLGLP
jgi:hypothetical protein